LTPKRVLVHVVAITFMAIDWLVIVNLFENMMNGTKAGLMTYFSACAFMVILDVLPVYSITPDIARKMKGLVSPEVDNKNYREKTFIVRGGIALFFIMMALFFTMSINNPERFAQVAENITVSGLGEFVGNTKLLAFICGILPIATTVASCLLNFSTLGDKLVDDEIKKCKKEIEKKKIEIKHKQEDIIRLDEANAILDNLSSSVTAIGNRITNYFSTKYEKLITNAKEEEDRVCGRARTKIREDVLRKVDDIKTTGKSKFEKAKLIGSKEYQNWQEFVNASTRRIMEKIS
jgi:hypothetical protein